ncbi:MAG: hypothetical protein AAGB05_03975 [Pseudomonadota bacterium]
MATPLHARDRCCRLQTTLPRTRSALLETATLEELGHDFEALALAGTQFDDALITTQNPGALIAGRGGYGALQTTGMPLRLSQCDRRMDLRFLPTAAINLARVTPQSGDVAPSVVAMDARGQVSHRVQVMGLQDRLVAQSLPRRANARMPGQSDIRGGANVIPLQAVRSAQANWDSMDIAHHLNDFLFDGGVTRRRCLAHVGANRAWRIQMSILPSFLAFLAARKVSFMRSVIGAGFLQADVGCLSVLRESDSVLLAREAERAFSLDLKAADAAWVTACGRHWQIEIFDHTEHGIAVLGAGPASDLCAWRDYLCSLPRAG